MGSDVTDHVANVTHEQTLDMASMLKVTLQNRGNVWSDNVLWNPGNEVELWGGYHGSLGFLGRGEIVRHLPNGPQSGYPTLGVKAYDRSYRMMQQEMELKGSSKRPKKANQESGIWWDATIDYIVRRTLDKYGISRIVGSEYKTKKVQFLQKKGTNDYQMLRSLALWQGAEFFIDYVPDQARMRGTSMQLLDAPVGHQGWIGWFRKQPRTQPKKYKFIYGQGETSTMLDYSLDWGMPAGVAEVQCWVWDRGANGGQGAYVKVVVEGDGPGNVKDFTSGTFAQGGAMGKAKTGVTQADPITNAAMVKIAASGHSIEVVRTRFKNPAEAAEFAKQWFASHRDSFVLGTIHLPGIETVRAGQVHELAGMGRRYDGDYYFSVVKQIFDGGKFTTECNVRKVLE